MASPSHIWAGLNDVTELAKMSDIPGIVDDLTSASTTDALSANQGNVLKELIDSIGGSIERIATNDKLTAYRTGTASKTYDISQYTFLFFHMVFEDGTSTYPFYNRISLSLEDSDAQVSYIRITAKKSGDQTEIAYDNYSEFGMDSNSASPVAYAIYNGDTYSFIEMKTLASYGTYNYSSYGLRDFANIASHINGMTVSITASSVNSYTCGPINIYGVK